MPACPALVTEALIGTGEAARRCGISRYTLLRAARRGDPLPTLRTPGGNLRFRPADIDAFAARLAPERGRRCQSRRAAGVEEPPASPAFGP